METGCPQGLFPQEVFTSIIEPFSTWYLRATDLDFPGNIGLPDLDSDVSHRAIRSVWKYRPVHMRALSRYLATLRRPAQPSLAWFSSALPSSDQPRSAIPSPALSNLALLKPAQFSLAQACSVQLSPVQPSPILLSPVQSSSAKHHLHQHTRLVPLPAPRLTSTHIVSSAPKSHW